MTSEIPDPTMAGFLADHFPPNAVAPFVAALVADTVPCTGELFSVGGGIASRVFLGITPGYLAARDAEAEDYLAHFDDILDVAGFEVPADAMAEVAYRARQLGVALAAPTLGADERADSAVW